MKPEKPADSGCAEFFQTSQLFASAGFQTRQNAAGSLSSRTYSSRRPDSPENPAAFYFCIFFLFFLSTRYRSITADQASSLLGCLLFIPHQYTSVLFCIQGIRLMLYIQFFSGRALRQLQNEVFKTRIFIDLSAFHLFIQTGQPRKMIQQLICPETSGIAH